MQIAIDAAPLLVRSAGVKNYLYHWLTHLRRLAPEGSIRTLPPLGELGPLNHDSSMAGRLGTFAGLGALALSNYTPLPVFDWLTRRADVFHASTLVRHPPKRPRLTATVYDMTCWLLPELHSAANLRADRTYCELLRGADGLIAISQSSKDDAVRCLGIRPERIRVIYPGIADAFFDPPSAEVERVRARYGLQRPYVLAVGTIEPRKNIGALVKAYAALPAEIRAESELVLAGPSGWASAETTGLVASVRYLGYVPEPDVAPLTAGAAVFAYPSLYEGFGFPVAQAMAAGSAVITSNVSSLPEITGDAALLIDPRSEAELTEALERLLSTPSLRATLGARGRERAARFRWPDCAAQSLDFFHSITG
ncbi:MAG TPA: glycosyltransferase family 1 protein [Candidatus Sulfopaludibacter sp.]|jgi:glycosyltransferase involved in cell wall biosynthesis|nr:glycosyltransferase family 1 protein [Candidatus Sulfopaludibacter sp.]